MENQPATNLKITSIMYKFILDDKDEYSVIYWLDDNSRTVSIIKNGTFKWQEKIVVPVKITEQMAIDLLISVTALENF